MPANTAAAEQTVEAITLGEARRLFGSAALAAGQAPEDPQGYAKWSARVVTIATDLGRMAESFQQRAARLAESQPIAGRILSVDLVNRGEGGQKGRIVFHPLSGKPDKRLDPDATEDITTEWLSDPDAAMVFEQAKLLVGREVVMYKRYDHDPVSGRNYRVCIGIEATGSASALEPPAAQPAPQAKAPTDQAQTGTSAQGQGRQAQQQRQPAPAQAAQPAPAQAALHVVDTATDANATALALVVSPVPDSTTLLKLVEDNQLGASREQVIETINTMYGRKLPAQRAKGEYADTWVALLASKYLAMPNPVDVKSTIEQVCGPLSEAQPERSPGLYAKIWLALTQEVGATAQAVGF